MKVVTCVGYHDTGSGAVDDYLRGFDNIAQSAYGVECRFLQDPDCISDLEYNIIENPHRLNTGYALKRYLRFVKLNHHTYSLIFGDAWDQESKKYIDSLTRFAYQGYWSGDMMLMSSWKRFTYYFRRAINKVVPKTFKKPSTWNYFPKEKTMHCSVTKEEFLEKTRDYVNSLLFAMNPENRDIVVLDQAVSAKNISRYLKYLPYGSKVIIVDRDPRDVFIEETLLKGRVLPKDAKEFCEVFRDSRLKNDSSVNQDSVLEIYFEDLIYDYENTKQLICDFVGLDSNMYNPKKSGFDPTVSVKNTRLWEKHPEFNKQVQIIEKELPEFLYYKKAGI